VAGKETEAPELDGSPRTHPGVHEAFDFVLPSYDWALRRFEAIDTRLRQIGMAAATFAVGAPVAARAIAEINLFDWWFIAASSVGAVVFAGALYAQTHGTIALPSIGLIVADDLEHECWAFRRHHLEYAAEAWAKNYRRINRRGRIATVLSVGLGVQIALFIVWFILAIRHHPPAPPDGPLTWL